MIGLDEYASHDALGLADLVARRQVSAKELAETALKAIEKLNPAINAVCRTLPPEIEAAAPDGPFAGVPFLTKELSAQAKGVRYDGG